MKKLLLLIIIVAAAGVSMAAEPDPQLHGTISVDFATRFIWRGYDAYAQNHTAIQPSVDVDLFGTGFGFNIWSSRANRSGFENSEWLTYTLYYGNVLFADENYMTAYKVGYTYFSYPDEPTKGSFDGVKNKKGPVPGAAGHAEEVFAGLAWPKITGIPGLVPSYAMFCYYPATSNAWNSGNAGWAHVFALNYDMEIPSLLDSSITQILHLGAHTVYNDAVGPNPNADHDWSHAVFTAALDFPINESLTFSPSVNYQSSWDDSVNTSDEYWTGLNLTYTF
jgi:hypothetical protein